MSITEATKTQATTIDDSQAAITLNAESEQLDAHVKAKAADEAALTALSAEIDRDYENRQTRKNELTEPQKSAVNEYLQTLHAVDPEAYIKIWDECHNGSAFTYPKLYVQFAEQFETASGKMVDFAEFPKREFVDAVIQIQQSWLVDQYQEALGGRIAPFQKEPAMLGKAWLWFCKVNAFPTKIDRPSGGSRIKRSGYRRLY